MRRRHRDAGVTEQRSCNPATTSHHQSDFYIIARMAYSMRPLQKRMRPYPKGPSIYYRKGPLEIPSAFQSMAGKCH